MGLLRPNKESSKKKILVVDDEMNICELLDSRLSKAGYLVIKALTGKDAIEMANKENPDLVILDINLPDIDGGEVARIIEENPATKDIPIIFLTALVRKEEEGEIKTLGGRSCFAKPFNAEELLKEIRIQIKHLPD